MILNPDDLARRKPVWIALSDLWLDTEIQGTDLHRIAEVLRASGYTTDELHGIYLYEVAPMVYHNLRNVAGEWTGFDPNVVCAEAEQYARKRTRLREFLMRLTKRPMTYATETHWSRLVALLETPS